MELFEEFEQQLEASVSDGLSDVDQLILDAKSREERHFQIVLSLLRNNESPLWVIEKADTIIKLLKDKYGTI